ncbi:unnamed protein product [Linum tenue]|uniref:Uncharacterized protein n=1 Tax=Linum tenue TaxID=586396 RepID=A0AAV0H6C6_9ROSI|nr:unnamed protein product [Linum tenue]
MKTECGYKDKTLLDADVVILATCFVCEKKLHNIFRSKRFEEIIVGSPDSVFPIYRGEYSESITNLFTSEMRSRWLAELLDGKFKLPAVKEMESEVAECDALVIIIFFSVLFI